MPTRGQTWYVDCSATSAGNGSLTDPLNSLQAASQLSLGPGDRVLFRRATSCTGMFEPTGNGEFGDPIVIGAYSYSSGSSEDPTINGGGTVAAVWLADMSYVTVQDLRLTNAGDSVALHRGLYFTSSAGLVSGITIQHLLVYDVDSNDSFSSGKTGGGIVGQTLSPVGRFSDVLIQANQVHDVSRQGITVYGTLTGSRPPATSPWPQASTGVVIQGNTVERTQGDGIVPLGTEGALVQRNSVSVANLAGYNYLSPDKNCAVGIWTWDSDNTVIQYNEVSDMVYGPSTKPRALNGCDGEGYDADTNQDGTIIQYNYSYDNAGGFLLLCTDTAPHRVVIRYNLSVDDNASFNYAPCSGTINPSTNNLNGDEMYNNTIVAPKPRVTLELNEGLGRGLTSLFGSFEFQNNIVFATSSQAAKHFFYCGVSCSNNLFYGRPSPSTATNSLRSNPNFMGSTAPGGGPSTPFAFVLRFGSPAIGVGLTQPADGFPPPTNRDYFGVRVGNRPSIGFSQY
jgi:hypothetical protein